MKKNVLIILLALPVLSVLQYNVFADADTNATYLKIVGASNDVHEIVQTLPDVEKLWPQEPDAYLKSIDSAAKALGERLSDASAKTAFVTIFTNMMSKSCPTNEEQAASWVRLKTEVIFFYVNRDEIKNSKSQWLSIAKFLKEIRSQIIPNYDGTSMMYSGVSMNPAEEAKIQQAITDNKRKQITNEWQAALRESNSTLKFLIKANCFIAQSKNPADTNFLNQISSVAGLTDKEQKEISW